MNNPIAIFYHVKLSNVDPPIIFDKAIAVMAEQILALEQSGLTAAASHIFVGVNGTYEDWAAAKAIAPEKAQVVRHPEGSRGEHPTMRKMQEWCRENPESYALYFHAKGVTHGDDPLSIAWRRCMMRCVVENWELCVRSLNAGFDAAGPHWVGPECAAAPIPNFFAGNFFWVKAKFMNEIPLIAPTAVEPLHRFDAEVLIARGPRPANAMKFCNHWPGAKCQEFLSQ